MIICQVVPSIFRVSLPLLPRYEKGYRLFEWLTPITYRMIKKRSPFSLSQTPSAVFKSVCPSHFKRRVSHLLLAPHLSNLLWAPHLKSLEPHLILRSPCFVEWWILWYSLSSLSVLLLIIHNDQNFLSATPKFPHAKPKLPNASP